MKKKDWILGVGVISAALLLLAGMNIVQRVQEKENQTQGSQVVITVDGEVYGKYDLSEDQVIEVKKNDFYNRIRIEDGKAYMEEADCPDGYCEEQGKISDRTQTIVCLPHKLVVEVEHAQAENLSEESTEKTDSEMSKNRLPDTIAK